MCCVGHLYCPHSLTLFTDIHTNTWPTVTRQRIKSNEEKHLRLLSIPKPNLFKKQNLHKRSCFQKHLNWLHSFIKKTQHLSSVQIWFKIHSDIKKVIYRGYIQLCFHLFCHSKSFSTLWVFCKSKLELNRLILSIFSIYISFILIPNQMEKHLSWL